MDKLIIGGYVGAYWSHQGKSTIKNIADSNLILELNKNMLRMMAMGILCIKIPYSIVP